jgi:beta-glucosidase
MTESLPLYRQAGQPLADRVEDLLARMTPEEKLGQLNTPFGLLGNPPTSAEEAERLVTGDMADAPGPIGGFFGLGGTVLGLAPDEQERLHARLQGVARERSRLGIPLLMIAEGCHGLMVPGATIFPEGPTLGSTWDPALIEDVYHAVAREARAIGVNVICTLVVEPNREPRLGRNCEAFSEDPWLTRELARAVVAGAQGDDVSALDRAGAALTAFPGQSQPVGGMERAAIELPERVMRSVFLPPWTPVSGPDGALAVMAMYPSIDGVPAHGSERWLTGVLRDELGFDGIVLSEGWGFDTLRYEGIVEDQKQAGVLALKAGVDVSITYEEAFRQPLLDSVAEGLLGEELLDRAVRRVLAVKFRLGLFDAPPAERGEGWKTLRTDAHLKLALRAAQAGIVLLKNHDATLPLRKDLARVAVLGPNAEDAANLLGDYVPAQVSQPVPSVVDAIRAKVGDSTEVVFERGCDITDLDEAGLEAAVTAAADADVAVVVVGERLAHQRSFGEELPPTVGEPWDVQSLDLSGLQEQLIRGVHATGTPTVVVLVNGRALSVCWAAEHVPALVEAWLPGERGAEAIADVLFGDVNPSGRLPVTVPRHVGQVPLHYDAKPSRDYWIRDGWVGTGGYVDGSGHPLFAFGHGLSYTTFEYEHLTVAAASEAGAAAHVSVVVRNTGERSGQEVVQLYVTDRHSSVATPIMELRGFEKVSLDRGERETVRFTLSERDLALLDARGELVVEPGVFDVLVGTSSADIRLRAELHVDARVCLAGAIPLMPS